MKKEDLLDQIAREQCRIETLKTRNNDGLDFHDVSVWSLKAALEKAFDEGANYGQPSISPALFELNRKMLGLSECAADECRLQLQCGDRVELSLVDMAQQYDLDVESNQALWDTVIEMIGERLDDPTLEFEIDKNELIITRAPEMEMGMGM